MYRPIPTGDTDVHNTGHFDLILTLCTALLQQVTQLCKMLTAILVGDIKVGNQLEALFVMSCCWSLGAALVEESRVKFDAYVKYLSSLPQPADEGTLAVAGERRPRSVTLPGDK